MNYELIDRDHNKPKQIINDIKKALKSAKNFTWQLTKIEKVKLLLGI